MKLGARGDEVEKRVAAAVGLVGVLVGRDRQPGVGDRRNRQRFFDWRLALRGERRCENHQAEAAKQGAHIKPPSWEPRASQPAWDFFRRLLPPPRRLPPGRAARTWLQRT